MDLAEIPNGGMPESPMKRRAAAPARQLGEPSPWWRPHDHAHACMSDPAPCRWQGRLRLERSSKVIFVHHGRPPTTHGGPRPARTKDLRLVRRVLDVRAMKRALVVLLVVLLGSCSGSGTGSQNYRVCYQTVTGVVCQSSGDQLSMQPQDADGDGQPDQVVCADGESES